jgi:5-methylcytosine-specific restriction endonuclease McrA
MHPHYSDKLSDYHLCWPCSFIVGKITEKEYLQHCGVSLHNAHAAIRKEKVVVWIGTKPPWKRTNKDERKTSEYKEWRERIFVRDKYTCQHCDQVGGDLNAHHKKPFAKYKSLRYEEDNGITLCTKCHKEEHRRLRQVSK